MLTSLALRRRFEAVVARAVAWMSWQHALRSSSVIGAPGYRPEHSRSSYDLAFELGAEAVEPDVVFSRDGVLVVRHENEIGGTTDVADHPEFADRRTTKTIDGVSQEGGSRRTSPGRNSVPSACVNVCLRSVRAARATTGHSRSSAWRTS